MGHNPAGPASKGRSEFVGIDGRKYPTEGVVRRRTVLQGQITDTIFEGERLLYFVSLPSLGAELQIYHHDPAEQAPHAQGATVSVGWTARDLLIFPAKDR